jgi:hypothetical protein
MPRIETLVITAVSAVVFPLLLFVAFWWSSAALAIYVVDLPTWCIALVAFTGLGIGLVGDLIFLKRWVALFYSAHWVWVTVIYLGLFTVGLAFCMGVPIGTFTVGVMGGAYLGRRFRYALLSPGLVTRRLDQGGLCAASLTALCALPMGWLALHDSMVMRLAGIFRLTAENAQGITGILAVIAVSLGLFALQFLATRAAGRLAFAAGR